MPERDTGINPHWDAYAFSLLFFGALVDFFDLEKFLDWNLEGNIAILVTGIQFMVVMIPTAIIYTKIKNKIMPAKVFIVYAWVNGKQMVIKRDVSKKDSIILCEHMCKLWGHKEYQS